MPLSAVIHLECLTPGKIDQFTGRGVHGFWFNRWRSVDPALADQLHSETQESPFTLSPLMGLPLARRGDNPIQVGQPAWLRITCLNEELTAAFLEKWLVGLEKDCQFEVPPARQKDGKVNTSVIWKISDALFENGSHPFAAQIPYEKLAHCHLMALDPPRQWQVEYLTPTAFNTGRANGGKDNHLPFPLPESLVKSWLRRWQAFAPLALPEEELSAWARSNLAVSAYRLQTQPAREGEHLRVGCVGRMTLRALDMPPYLRAAVDLLVSYSFYCGSGSHTAQGMGQTRLLGSR
jgi:CRISPR-associated endoribonuclease Cas6